MKTKILDGMIIVLYFLGVFYFELNNTWLTIGLLGLLAYLAVQLVPTKGSPKVVQLYPYDMARAIDMSKLMRKLRRVKEPTI